MYAGVETRTASSPQTRRTICAKISAVPKVSSSVYSGMRRYSRRISVASKAIPRSPTTTAETRIAGQNPSGPFSWYIR